jgi:hypothetical protein
LLSHFTASGLLSINEYEHATLYVAAACPGLNLRTFWKHSAACVKSPLLNAVLPIWIYTLAESTSSAKRGIVNKKNANDIIIFLLVIFISCLDAFGVLDFYHCLGSGAWSAMQNGGLGFTAIAVHMYRAGIRARYGSP